MVSCPTHPCKCGRRGQSKTDCTWRGLLVKYIASGELARVIGKKGGALTYLQVMEMHGHRRPANPK
eukprot:9429245-Lingulodinium_polyedra.AAC.1